MIIINGKVIEVEGQYVDIETDRGIVVGYCSEFGPIFPGQYVKAQGFLEKKYLDANRFIINTIEVVTHD